MLNSSSQISIIKPNNQTAPMYENGGKEALLAQRLQISFKIAPFNNTMIYKVSVEIP